MKKGILVILPIVFCVFFFSARMADASYGFSGFFGGRITSIEAKSVKEKENSGYQCMVPGTSITINPIGSPPGTPTDYLIPYYASYRTSSTPGEGKLILGAYSGISLIICYMVNPPYTPDAVVLPTITIFGTSGGTSLLGNLPS